MHGEAYRPRTAIIYAAKSTTDEHGSIPTQIEDCRRMAEREGWTVLAVYHDEAFSGWSGDRGPALAQAMAHAARAASEGQAPALLAQHSDRFARGDGERARHLGEIYFQAKRAQYVLRSVQDDATFSNFLLTAAMGERNAEDSRRKALAVSAGLDRRAGKGMHNGGPRKYGYEYVRDAYGRTVPEEPLRPHPVESSVVERIFRTYVGGASQQQIQRDLNADGIGTARDRKWHQGTIGKILADRFYAGAVRHGEEWIPGKHAAIVSPDLWHEAEAIRKAGRKGHRAGGRPPRTTYLFTKGMLRCGRCGGAMVPRTGGQRANPKTGKPWGENYERYRCLTRIQDSRRCDQPPLPRAAIDRVALISLKEVGLSREQTRLQIIEASAQALQATRAQISEAERDAGRAAARLGKIDRDYLDGDLSAARYERLLARCEEEVEAAHAHLTQLRTREAALVGRAEDPLVIDELSGRILAVSHAIQRAEIAPGSVDEIRALVRRLFESFTVVALGDGRYVLHGRLWPEVVESIAEDGSVLIHRVAEPALATTDAMGLAR